MAIQDLLTQKVNIAGREVPMGVILLGGGGIVVVFLIARGNQAPGPSQNPIDQAQQAQDLANQVGNQSNANPNPDVSGQISTFMSGFSDQMSKALATQNKQSEEEIAKMQSGFQNQLTSALAAQNQQSQAALAQLQSELSQFRASQAQAIPGIIPTPEAVVSGDYSSPAAPYIPPAQTPIRKATPPAPAPVQKAAPTVPLAQLPTAPKPKAPPVSSKVLGANPELAYVRNQVVPSPGPSGTYTVQSGNTLSGIARKYGVSLSALISANPQIANPNLIRVGQKINVPGSTTTDWHGGNPYVNVT